MVRNTGPLKVSTLVCIIVMILAAGCSERKPAGPPEGATPAGTEAAASSAQPEPSGSTAEAK